MEIKRKIIIFGAGKNGVKLMSQLGESKVCFFCDNYKAGDEICGKKVISFSELKKVSQNLEYDIILSTNTDDIRKQLEKEKIQYWEYHGFANNFFNREDVRNILDEELYNQYLNLHNYEGKSCRIRNWYRNSYNSDINEKLVTAMKNKDDKLISQILLYTYDNENGKRVFEDECFENRPGMRLAAKLIRKNKGTKINVCDFACGHGGFLREINSELINCYGIDFSFDRCQSVRLSGIECKVGNLEQCEYESEFFDYVTMMECLEHVVDPFAVMKEAYRVLKRAGGADLCNSSVWNKLRESHACATLLRG